MEHLNYKQFSSVPLNPWRRHNYYSEEELREMWKETYAKVKGKLDKEKGEN